MDLDEHPDLAEFVDEVRDSLESIQSGVKILAVGLDYRKYSRFRLLTPVIIHRMASGEYKVNVNSWGRDLTATPDDVEFCIEFVIEAAIRLREFDYDVGSPP